MSVGPASRRLCLPWRMFARPILEDAGSRIRNLWTAQRKTTKEVYPTFRLCSASTNRCIKKAPCDWPVRGRLSGERCFHSPVCLCQLGVINCGIRGTLKSFNVPLTRQVHWWMVSAHHKSSTMSVVLMDNKTINVSFSNIYRGLDYKCLGWLKCHQSIKFVKFSRTFWQDMTLKANKLCVICVTSIILWLSFLEACWQIQQYNYLS